MSKPTIWHIAAWWPTKEKPGNGLFIKAHIESVLDFASHGVIHLRLVESKLLLPQTNVEFINTNPQQVLVSISTPVRRFGVLEFLIKRGYKRAFHKLKRSLGEPEMIHFHVRNHLSKMAITSSCLPQVPTLLTEHFSFYHRGIHELDETEKTAEIREIKQFFASKSLKAILPVSEQLASVLIDEYAADAEKIKVIPNIAEDCFEYKPCDLTDATRIALVAAWNNPKNPFLFFQALSKINSEILSKLQIDIIGHGRQLPEMEKMAKQLNLNIKFHGYKPRQEIAHFLQTAHFFCLPTDRENSPTVIAEALCCGCPVISMDTNGIPEMIDDSNGILVPPKDETALRIGLEKMIKDKLIYNRESIATEAKAKYASKRIGEQIRDVYQSILR